jgi:thiol-disulfide isomerase/thioredoxin
VTKEEKAFGVSADDMTRRAVLTGVPVAIATALVLSFPASALSAGPPAFGTARHQFTILQPARMVPPVAITRLDGSAANFASFLGKVVLVNFWATWCPACRTELPLLDRLQETVGRKDLEVLAVSVDRGGRPTIAPFLRQLNIRHLNVCLDPGARLARGDDGDSSATAFPLYGMPISYIVSPAGRIEGYMTGEADWSSEEARNLLGYYLDADRGPR